jgi:ABC-type multidrug transport system fused ATPase/permease subunit
LVGLYEGSKGEILFYGNNIKDIDKFYLRKEILYIPKDFILFEGTLKENLDINNEYTVDQLEEKLKNFDNLFNKNEFIIFKNLSYSIAKNGNNLSEGQKSILQLLRSILKNPSILCLDESNAELDDEIGNKFNIIYIIFRKIDF